MHVPIGRVKAVGAAVAQVAIYPANARANAFQVFHRIFQGLGAVGAPGQVSHAGLGAVRDFEGVVEVVAQARRYTEVSSRPVSSRPAISVRNLTVSSTFDLRAI